MLRLQYTMDVIEAEIQTPTLDRIAAVLEALEPLAEPLLARLNKQRGERGRDDYPNRVLWRCLVAFGCLGYGAGFCEFADDCRQKLKRVKLRDDNLRHLGPVPRASKQFARLYAGRAAVERSFV